MDPIREHKPVYLVGDRFGHLSLPQKTITISRCEELLSQGEPLEDQRIVLGQGVSEARYQALYKAFRNAGASLAISPSHPPAKASKAATHKHHARNIAIGAPQRIDAKTFETILLLDDVNDEMADHLTGIHIQGMMIIEAARQFVLAASEDFIAPSDRRGKLRFSTIRMETNYHGFLLPFDVDMRLHQRRLRMGPAGDFVLTAEVLFIQHRKIAADVTITVSAIDREFLEIRENRQLAALVEAGI